MERRNFIKNSYLLSLAAGLSPQIASAATDQSVFNTTGSNEREYWINLLMKISEPILSNMSKGELKKNFIVEYSPTWDQRNGDVAYMEAFGRLIAGVAPFAALADGNEKEEKTRALLRTQIQHSLIHAVDPSSPDYLYWGNANSRQPLVDAAYIAQALMTAPEALWHPLPETTKKQLIKEFKGLRQIIPFNNNWVLFAAMVESFLLLIDEEVDFQRINNGIDTIQKWYVGDGWYSDGDRFHFDHYNGYVIHPMLVEVLKISANKGKRSKEEFDTAYKRMQRYGWFQERYISPEGYYPIIGRSSTYRAGAFQPLCKLALDEKLPEGITPAQVRCGLSAVLKNLFVPTTFTKQGFLTLGLVGDKQNNLADYYSNTGSMYITSLVFLPLGLPNENNFWKAPDEKWTQKKAWSGDVFPKDYAVNY